MILGRRKKRTSPRPFEPRPKGPVPTELPVFGELERLGLAVPMSAQKKGETPRPGRSKRRR